MNFKDKVTSIFTNLKQKLYKINIKIIQFIKNNDAEISIFIGILFISYATYKVNYIAFLYLLGFIFILFSVFLLKYPKKKVR